MNKKIVIIGASGHGKVVADIIIKSGDKIVGFLDDYVKKGTVIENIVVLGTTDDYNKYINCEFVIAIGNPKIREMIANKLDVKWYTAIHPNAVISSLGVNIDKGTVVMANAVINSCAKIGKHCIINTASVVEHDNELGDYVHISPNATLAGTVKVGKYTHIGVGACVKNNVTITQDCIIGAGSVVVKDIDNSGIYLGVPANIR
jgi:sugar O-acyltransferase (sialic acid O-acetyltransferase NeuD family)